MLRRRYQRKIFWIEGKKSFHPSEIRTRKAKVLEILGYWKEAESIYQDNLNTALTVEDRGLVAATFNNLGENLRLRGEYQRALEMLHRALDEYQKIGDFLGMGDVMGKIGLIYITQCKYEQAMECLKKKRQWVKGFENETVSAQMYGMMGHIHYYQNEYDLALDCYQRQLDFARRTGDLFKESIVIGNIGNVHKQRGELQKAMECYRRKLRLAEHCGDRQGVSISLGNIGNLLKEMDEYAEALEYFQKCWAITEPLGDRKNMGILAGNLGSLYLIVKDYVRAEEWLSRAIALNQGTNQLYYLCENYFNLTELWLELNRSTEAREDAIRAGEIASSIGRRDISFRSELLRLVAEAYQDREKAIAALFNLLENTADERKRAYIVLALWRASGEKVHGEKALKMFIELERISPNNELRRTVEWMKSAMASS